MPVSPPVPSLSHTIWLRDHNAAFVYLPKVACTSWKLYLWQALGNALPDGFDYRHVHDVATLPLPYVASLSPDEQAQFQAGLSSGAIAIHAVIREPRARILSAYLDKIEHHANPDSYFSTVVIPEIQQFAGLDAATRPSFAHFLAWIERHADRNTLNDHWRPMSSILGSSDANADARLWTMDQMDQAIAFFAELLDCSLPFPSRQQLGERRTYNSQSQIDSYFGSAELQLFNRIYSADEALYQQLQGL